MKNPSRSCTLAAFLCCLVSATAEATVVRAETLEEMARASTAVVRGVVLRNESRWGESPRVIYTFTELRVVEALKGKVGASLVVRELGGVVGATGQSVAGAARFAPGEEVVLFLEPARDDPGVYLVHSMGAGKVLLRATGGKEVRAFRNLDGLAFYKPTPGGPGPRAPATAEEDLGDSKAFLERIRKLVGTVKGGAR